MKGLTLIELLIAVSVSAVVGTLLMLLIVNSTGIYYQQSSKLQQGTSTNDLQINISENIKISSAVVDSVTLDGNIYISGSTQLILKIPATDSSNNIIADTFDYFVYFLEGNKLRFKTFPNINSARQAQDRIFSTLVDSLTFQFFDSATPPAEVNPTNTSKIRMTIRLKQKSGASYETSIATAEANLRND